jgi:L-rhamnose isomerase
MKHVEVGMFKLPGITFKMDSLAPNIAEEMVAWAKENRCGTCMGPGFWSFKTDAQRDWFILRWIDSIPKEEVKE